MSTDYDLWIEKYTPLINIIEYLCDIEFYDIQLDDDNDLWLKAKDKNWSIVIVIVRARLNFNTLQSALEIIKLWKLVEAKR